MGALKSGLATLALIAPWPVTAQGVERWRPYVVEASARYALPVPWIEQVIRVESGGKTMLAGRPITSPAGAMGLMQLMPATWAAMRDAYGLGTDPFDPHDNIIAGTAYLRLLYDRFGYPAMFAAYNAGPGRYSAYLAGRRGLPHETIRYLASTTGGAPQAANPVAVPPMFIVRLAPLAAAAPTLFAIAPRR